MNSNRVKNILLKTYGLESRRKFFILKILHRDEVKRNHRNSTLNKNQNISRTLSLNSDMNFHLTNPSFREVSTIGLSGIP